MQLYTRQITKFSIQMQWIRCKTVIACNSIILKEQVAINRQTYFWR